MAGGEVAERRFRWLLGQRRYRYWDEHELARVITVQRTRPDFFVRTPHDGDFLVEVESFQEPTILRTMDAGVISLDGMKLQKRINRAVRNAAAQLEPYQDKRIPLVVALDNWRQVGLSLGVVDLIQVFGLVEVQRHVNLDTGLTSDPVWAHADDDGSPSRTVNANT